MQSSSASTRGRGRGHWCRIVKVLRAATSRKYMRRGVAAAYGARCSTPCILAGTAERQHPSLWADRGHLGGHGRAPHQGALVHRDTEGRSNSGAERREIVTMGVEAFNCWYGMIELSLAGCELLAGSRTAAARADAEQRRRDPVVRVPGVRGHRQRHGRHPWERAAAVRKGVCSVDGASVRFKPNSC